MKAPIYNSEWSDEVKALYRHDLQEVWDKTISRHIYNQYQNQLELYKRLAKTKQPLSKILDVGCAQGTLALILAEEGYQVTAVDLRQEFLDYAATRYEKGYINFHKCDVINGGIEGKYDLIFFNQIIEHIVYPFEALRHLKGNLQNNGFLVITTPNHDYLRNRLPSYSKLGNLADWEHLQNTADGDGHFFSYTLSELVSVLRKSGYDLIEKGYFETPFISGHMKLRHIHGFTSRPLLKIMEKVVSNLPILRRIFCHQLFIVAKISE